MPQPHCSHLAASFWSAEVVAGLEVCPSREAVMSLYCSFILVTLRSCSCWSFPRATLCSCSWNLSTSFNCSFCFLRLRGEGEGGRGKRERESGRRKRGGAGEGERQLRKIKQVQYKGAHVRTLGQGGIHFKDRFLFYFLPTCEPVLQAWSLPGKGPKRSPP